jgi:hypothetical protein
MKGVFKMTIYVGYIFCSFVGVGIMPICASTNYDDVAQELQDYYYNSHPYIKEYKLANGQLIVFDGEDTTNDNYFRKFEWYSGDFHLQIENKE